MMGKLPFHFLGSRAPRWTELGGPYSEVPTFNVRKPFRTLPLGEWLWDQVPAPNRLGVHSSCGQSGEEPLPSPRGCRESETHNSGHSVLPTTQMMQMSFMVRKWEK